MMSKVKKFPVIWTELPLTAHSGHRQQWHYTILQIYRQIYVFFNWH